MTFQTPKTDWTSADGVDTADLNRIEGNIGELKGDHDSLELSVNSHHSDTTIHKTSSTIRNESATALTLEVRSDDPSSPAVGRIWINTSG